MTFKEGLSVLSEMSKFVSSACFDIDKRAEFSPNRDTARKAGFDIDKRVDTSHQKVSEYRDRFDIDKRAENETLKDDRVCEKIGKSISTDNGLEKLKEVHPEKSELWESLDKSVDALNNPDASVFEVRSAQGKISSIKGQIMEIAVKDEMKKAELDVDSTQRIVKGESGDTKPDVVAHNKTDELINVLGVSLKPGESIFVECKCGGKEYLNDQLKNHIPNQLSGHQGGKSILLTTSDIKNTPRGHVESVCEKYGTKCVVLDVSTKQVDNSIKEVFGK